MLGIDLTKENEPVLVSNLKKNSSYLYQIKYLELSMNLICLHR